MDPLFCLPVEVWREHILDWLLLKDIVNATSAFVNRNTRSHFLSLTDGHSLKQRMFVCTGQAEKVMWCMRNNILPRRITVSKELDSQTYSALPAFCGRMTNVMYAETAHYVEPTFCPRLVCLELYRCLLTSLGSLRGPSALNPNPNPSLTALSLEECPNITNASLLASLTGCIHLEKSTIEDCKQIDERAISYILNNHLRLVCVKFYGTMQRAYDLAIILNELSTMSRIRSIDLMYHCTVNSESLRKLTKLFPRLQKLHFCGFTGNVTDADVSNLVRSCSELTDLTVTSAPLLTNCFALQPIALYLPFLLEVDLFNCVNISNEGVMAIANGCAKLNSVNLSMCSKVTDEAVQEIWLKCLYLESLHISGCTRVTDAAFKERINTVLLELNVSETQVFGSFTRHAPMLIRLYCNSCPNINTAFVSEIASRPNHLTNLYLAYSQLCTADLLVLSLHLPRLKFLQLPHCFSVNDTVVRSFVVHCPRLCYFFLSGCATVSRAVMQELRYIFESRR